MQIAAANMERAFESHQRFLEDWLSRFEQIMERKNG